MRAMDKSKNPNNLLKTANGQLVVFRTITKATFDELLIIQLCILFIKIKKSLELMIKKSLKLKCLGLNEIFIFLKIIHHKNQQPIIIIWLFVTHDLCTLLLCVWNCWDF